MMDLLRAVGNTNEEASSLVTVGAEVVTGLGVVLRVVPGVWSEREPQTVSKSGPGTFRWSLFLSWLGLFSLSS